MRPILHNVPGISAPSEERGDGGRQLQKGGASFSGTSHQSVTTRRGVVSGVSSPVISLSVVDPVLQLFEVRGMLVLSGATVRRYSVIVC